VSAVILRLLYADAFQVPELPFRIFAATTKDGYRKPMPGMWFELERIFAKEGITIGSSCPSDVSDFPLIFSKDKSASYYVGDAAGRADDFASTDRKLALNVRVKFYTPEVRPRIQLMRGSRAPS